MRNLYRDIPFKFSSFSSTLVSDRLPSRFQLSEQSRIRPWTIYCSTFVCFDSSTLCLSNAIQCNIRWTNKEMQSFDGRCSFISKTKLREPESWKSTWWKEIVGRTVMLVKLRKGSCAATMKFQESVMREPCTCKCRMGGWAFFTQYSQMWAFFLFLLFDPIKSCRDKRIRRSDLKMAKWKVDELEFKDLLI